MSTAVQRLTLLQLASPALPIGAYSYSEGIETLAMQGKIAQGTDLQRWLEDELRWGAVRVETAVMLRGQALLELGQPEGLVVWNDWLSAFRETEEMRSQSWQMGRSLLRLLSDLDPTSLTTIPLSLVQSRCNFAIAYAIAAHTWQISATDAALAYLHSWAANLVSAAVRAVPLGQTEGQRILRHLIPSLQQAQAEIAALPDTDLMACNWGVALASMQHETQYSRLFRS